MPRPRSSPLSHISFIYNGKEVQVGLFREFDKAGENLSLSKIIGEIESFNKRYKTDLKLISHPLADFLLMKTDFWPSLNDYSPFITDAIIAYEAPGKTLGQEIFFEFRDVPKVILKTGNHAGASNLGLLVLDLKASDFVISPNAVTIDVPDDRLVPLKGFPEESG